MTPQDVITARFVDALRKGTVPWHRTWVNNPRNLASHKPYQGVNTMLALMDENAATWFATYNQAKRLGGSVKRGSRGYPVVFYKVLESRTQRDSAGNPTTFPMLRYSTVFPLYMLDGIEAPDNGVDTIVDADAVVARNAPSIVTGGMAAYRPSDDAIIMPPRGDFESSAAYYSTLFHELVHWSGAPARLNRELGNASDVARYAREELVAEIGAAFLRHACGIEHTPTVENSEAYVATWCDRLQRDPKAIIVAARAAQAALDYLTGAKASEAAA